MAPRNWATAAVAAFAVATSPALPTLSLHPAEPAAPLFHSPGNQSASSRPHHRSDMRLSCCRCWLAISMQPNVPATCQPCSGPRASPCGGETVGKSKRVKGGNGLSSQHLLLRQPGQRLAPPHPPPPEAVPQPEGLSLGQCGFTLTPGSSVIPWEPLGTQVPQCKTYTVLFFFF